MPRLLSDSDSDYYKKLYIGKRRSMVLRCHHHNFSSVCHYKCIKSSPRIIMTRIIKRLINVFVKDHYDINNRKDK